MNAIAERRKYRRTAFKGAVKIQKLSKQKGGNNPAHQSPASSAQGHDISVGGLRLTMDQPLEIDILTRIVFSVGRVSDTTAFARVVWNDKATSGLQFLMIENSAIIEIQGLAETT